MSWGHYGYSTFVQLEEWADSEAISRQGSSHYLEKGLEAGRDLIFLFRPLTQIHLYALEGGGPIIYVYIFSAVAIFILLIACFNFMNLATARSATRMREIGVRKVVGADRKKLILQFLGESIFMSLVALAVALVLSGLLLKPLRQLGGDSVQPKPGSAYGSSDYFDGCCIDRNSGGLLSCPLPVFVPSCQYLEGKAKIRFSSVSEGAGCLSVFNLHRVAYLYVFGISADRLFRSKTSGIQSGSHCVFPSESRSCTPISNRCGKNCYEILECSTSPGHLTISDAGPNGPQSLSTGKERIPATG